MNCQCGIQSKTKVVYIVISTCDIQAEECSPCGTFPKHSDGNELGKEVPSPCRTQHIFRQGCIIRLRDNPVIKQMWLITLLQDNDRTETPFRRINVN